MVEKTKYVNKMKLSEEQYVELENVQKVILFQKVIDELAKRFYDFIDNDSAPVWRKIKDKDLYYIHYLKLVVSDVTKQKVGTDATVSVTGMNQNTILDDDAKLLFRVHSKDNPFIDSHTNAVRVKTVSDGELCFTCIWTESKKRYRWSDDTYLSDANTSFLLANLNTLKLPSTYLADSLYKEENRLFWEFIDKQYCIFEDEFECELFKLICQLKLLGFVKWIDSGIYITYSEECLNKIESLINKKTNKIMGISFDDNFIKAGISNMVLRKEDDDYKKLIDSLISCDEQRTHMEKHPEHILMDPESGHWDLWTDDAIEKTISFEENLVARNPIYDALTNRSGVVGIDFGTKSTVVTYRQSTADVMPMRIGSGQYSRAVTMSDYENPTVMEIRNIETFMEAYNAKIGRPDTSWNDLLISHEAFSQLIQEQRSGDTFASFFSELKQWASDKERQVTLRDANGVKINIPPYLSIEDEDFDPIEIYAYYIGLFINNMHNNKIYLRYRLSFPAKAEKKVREKILNSFEKGIKKSLPAPVLNSEECMKIFRVEQGASEPVAYAICALQEYGFEPEDDESIYYGIFDFGGGTTDFDFGVWSSEEDDDNYDYRISRFGEGEDPYLGGENILGMLAYEVFLDNFDNLLKDNIIFIKPYGAKVEVGKDWLIRQDSQFAHFNSKRLMEKMRGVWENEDEVRTMFASGTIQVSLFDKDGNSHNNYNLSVKLEKLDGIIREKIESGVSQFFSTLKNSFDIGTSLNKIHDIAEINVFLAGNSCKSKMVLDVFKKHIESLYESMGCDESQRWIKIYPPLGSVQAEKIQSGTIKPEIGEIIEDLLHTKENVPTDDETEYIIEKIKKPNGKTGVAFGLLDNKVKIVQNEREESRFKFYLGQNRKKKFRCIIDKDKQPYNVWKRFCSASVDTFDIWFTRSSEAPSNALDITTVGIYSEPGFINAPDEKANVYIRLVSPTEIEYVISDLDEEKINKNGAILQNIESLSLQEKE